MRCWPTRVGKALPRRGCGVKGFSTRLTVLQRSYAMRCQMVGTIVLLGLVLCIPWQSSAQISVIDTAHLVQNTISAVQNVEMVQNMLLELTPLDELILADGFREDLNTLAQLVNEASGMAWELTSLNAQFDQLFGTG